ncbi:MAG: hypothetical protein J6V44_15310 [Methanobrevibacter sp.]|nr:hypothetical protein [Methanobrevibacter sp.]
MNWNLPTFADIGINGYICKWGGRTQVDRYGVDKVQKDLDKVYEGTGIRCTITRSGKIVIPFYEGQNYKLKESHSIYDRFGIVIADGKEAWILHTDSKYNLKYIKKYIDENLDDITYTLKSAAEVADYLQGVCFNKLHQFVDVDFVPETTNEESTTIKLGNTLISVVDWEYV